LDQTFDALINSYIDEQWGTAEDFLPPALAAQLLAQLLSLRNDGSLLPAGTGNKQDVLHDLSIRSDRICWLDPADGKGHETAFFELMDRFVRHLNDSCYTGITGYEFHYALYEAGSFYKRHRDAFRNDNSRKFSMIMYLNADWQEADGGELCVHPTGQPAQRIAPRNGSTVFFKSNELEHEVLLTHKPRMSITGWLKG
jgi:SM-20-related protein